ncbi:hypothetical protein BDZ94DRAFT_1236582 [Collybia nuda]|uniref:Hydrophobin n=1 Tax=Collybia nuda TaxID=64659 RepID=A0A9P5Y6W5_9AGAR|nr:hypothetical protein BDZ94DRAFT_1236582 [Collybia nuda]
MQFKYFLALAFATLAMGSPTPDNISARIDCITVFSPDTCPGDHPLSCNGAGAITLCCAGHLTGKHSGKLNNTPLGLAMLSIPNIYRNTVVSANTSASHEHHKCCYRKILVPESPQPWRFGIKW